MSFVITLFVREGIVMAADSRLTINIQQQLQGQTITQFSVGQSDSSYKLFLTPNRIGISTCGAADIGGIPIAGFIESFIDEYLGLQSILEVEAVPPLLLQYFRKMTPPPDAQFHVSGYKTQGRQRIQQVWTVAVSAGDVKQANITGGQGVAWGGEADILTRLIQPVFARDSNNTFQPLPTFEIPWKFFTLQDAIDFAVYALRTTIDSIRFMTRPKTIGGPIDVLVIKPTDAFWVQRKVLHGQ